MHEVPNKSHWHEPSGGRKAGFGDFGRPKTPYDLLPAEVRIKDDDLGEDIATIDEDGCHPVGAPTNTKTPVSIFEVHPGFSWVT